MEQLLSEAEVATRLQVPPVTVKYWRASRTGPAFIRVGKHVRYRPSAIDDWLDSRSVTSGAVA